MPTTVTDIRRGIAANLTAVQDGQNRPQVLAYRKDNPSPPTIQVSGLDEILPTAFQAGGFEIPVLVQAFVSANLDRAAQELLDSWLFPQDGALSVWQAIESDRTLGGKVDDVTVKSCDGSVIFVLPNGTRVLGSTWHVQVDI